MPEEILIEPRVGPFFRLFLHSQFFRTPRFPTQSFANQTIIVTGSNVGLGLEAARHFYRLKCAKLIIAVRTISKGQAAKEEILRTVRERADADVIEIWALDLSSTASTIAFSERVNNQLPRVDVLVENAGINNKTLAFSEDMEQTMQVNAINTFLLALLLLPKLVETARVVNSVPHLTIVTSEAHHLTKFPQINSPDIYESLNDEKSFNGQSSYEISKLIQILFLREFVSRTSAQMETSPLVVINMVNPGLCVSTLATRGETSAVMRAIGTIAYKIIGRTTEVGSRALVLGAAAGPTSHGEYMSDGENQAVESWIYSDMGKAVQQKVFEQTMKVLELRNPGIRHSVGL
ncbi:hypothetical protein HYFRA_00009053 [Hymenoscyphus fraxineus]|uniref:Uncharacterized protein n=1 Tax=Hymenoscyphus fraxineus TaxID=746836 RepID=A0A9N9PRV8_9HELO|nr:hypothetical protein HYFRA_00009053 [Hymenoscyphus fraxineus]